MSQLEESLLLDLPHSLSRNSEECADILERHRIFTIQSEIQPQDLRLSLFQSRERFFDRLRERFLERLLVRRAVRRVRQIIEEPVVFTRGHRRIEREMHLRDEHRLRDFFFGYVQTFGDLEVSRLAPELLQQRARALSNSMQRAGAV